MAFETIQVSTAQDGICTITMNRPEALNALSDVTISELSQALDQIETREEVRVVIITGNGKAFVAGADISYMTTLTADESLTFSKDTTEIYRRMNNSKRIFIAAVNGFAMGGGCEFALACDLRIASEKAVFALPEVGLGILPGGGGTQRLSRLVGTQKAAELILTGTVIKGAEALACGLVCQVVEPESLMEKAMELAQKVIKNSPLAVSYAKRCIRQSEQVNLEAGIELENMMFGLCFADGDRLEGLTAFVEGRKPVFKKTL
jgi:Enoyl-CoA hydratase/carnithine racemase